MSLLGSILKRALRHPRRIAAVDDRGETRYGELAAGALCVAETLDQTTPNPHVGLLLPTSAAFPTALLGAWLSRRVAVPLNYLLGPEQLGYCIRDAGLDTVIAVEPMLEFVGRDALPDEVTVLRLEDVDFRPPPPLRWPPALGNDELAALLYTSGTSGYPKGVMLTHGNLAHNVDACIEHAGMRSADRFLGILPQFHSFGLTALTLLPLRLGATAVYASRFEPRRMIQLLRKHRPAVVMAIPSMYAALLSVKKAAGEDFASVRFPVSGGEPLSDAVREGFVERFGVELLEGYGLTETGPVLTWSNPATAKRGSVGRPLPDVSIAIVDDHDRPQPPETEGEILAAGPNVMAGYYRLPELTAEAFARLRDPADGREKPFFRTGDMGRLDADGFLYVTGRRKEMLIVGGENVFPREIEEVLARHPAVADAAVVGRLDATRGEVPVAYVETTEETPVDEAELREWCRDRLPGYKVPRAIERLEALPRGPTGKVLRRKLAERERTAA